MKRRCSLLSLVIVGVLGGSCGSEPPPKPPPKKVLRGVDLKNIPAPNHSPEDLMGPGKMKVEPTGGFMRVRANDEQLDYAYLPKIGNAAVYFEDTGIARLTVVGSSKPTGGPTIRILVEHLRLDQVTFPAELGYKKRKGKEPVVPTVRFQLNGSAWWESKPEDFKSGKSKVTLTSLEGRILKGSFEGTVYPRHERIGEPIELKGGRFEATLRMRGLKFPDE